ncbi:MAG: M15 family metallopeptidase [Verrucomicrobiota bacterium]|nr:M15 family metallopeptidase [Verrucomicrobiota bacterium]
MTRSLIFLFFLSLAYPLCAQPTPVPSDDFAMVNIRDVAPSIVIELRYATNNNIAGHAIYPANAQPWVRAGVARRLIAAQKSLREFHYGLKVWDAYRPEKAQQRLWEVAPNPDFVADPHANVGSLHTRGAAVDVTLVDEGGHALSMPTDFDDFTPAAMLNYHGPDENVRRHLSALQWAMSHAGFYGLRTEWWHFTPSDWHRYLPSATSAMLKHAVVVAGQ